MVERQPPVLNVDPTIAEVMVAYLEHARVYYRQSDGSDGREFELIRDVLGLVRKNASRLPARDFGPKKLKEIRQSLIDKGLSRKYINNQVDRIKRMFKWAAGDQLIPGSVYLDLSMVTGLRRGRSAAREMPPVESVSDVRRFSSPVLDRFSPPNAVGRSSAANRVGFRRHPAIGC